MSHWYRPKTHYVKSKDILKLSGTSNLAIVITKLIHAKEARDGRRFTPATLARQINVDRSLIQRILNSEVKNPRMDTLIKITQYFVKEGFNLRIDDLIGLSHNTVDVTDQPLIEETAITLPLYQMEPFEGIKIGSTSVTMPNPSPGLIAMVSTKEIKPMFKPGSLFIIDTLKKPIHNHLVAIKNNTTVDICKLIQSDHSLKSKSLESEIINIPLKNNILGVVVRINAKT